MKKIILPLCVLFANGIYAQKVQDSTKTKTIEEVELTGFRGIDRTDKPVAVSKIGRTLIEDTKPRVMREIISKVPGVYVAQTSNAEGAGVMIRQPLDFKNYYLFMEDGIPLHPQGIFNHNSVSSFNNIMAVDNVEIIKGPTSASSGPEAVGGSVNVITKKGGDIPTFMLGYHGDQYKYHRLLFNGSGKIANKLGLFVGGIFGGQRNGGYRKGTDFTKNAINIRADYDINDKTTLTAAMAYNLYDNDYPTNVDKASFYAKDYFDVENDYSKQRIQDLRTRMTLNHAWNENHHTEITSYLRNQIYYYSGSSTPSWRVGQTTASTTTTHRRYHSFGVIGKHDMKLSFLNSKLTIGGSYDYTPLKSWGNKLNLGVETKNGGQNVRRFFFINEDLTSFNNNYETDNTSIGLYAQYDFEPIEKLKVYLGARQDIIRYDYLNILDANKEGRISYTKITPKIGVTYTINDTNGIYANYSQGYNPPNINNILTKRQYIPTGSNLPDFLYDLGAATFQSMEIGTWLSLWDNRLKLDITLYQLLGENETVNMIQPNGKTQTESAGSTIHRGVEFGAIFNPFTDLSLRTTGSYAVHKYKKFVVDAVNGVDYSGNHMASAPNLILNSEITYKPSWLRGFRIGAEWHHLSSWYLNASNTTKYEEKGFLGLKGHSLLNLRAGFEFRGIDIFANLNNATNVHYPYSISKGNAANATEFYVPGPPRILEFGLKYTIKGAKK